MMSDLEIVLQGFDERTTPVDEFSVCAAIRVLRKESDTTPPTTEWLAETMAFDFTESYQSEADKSIWGTYFGPMMVWKDQDGITKESPSISKVTPDIINYWAQRAKTAKNRVLKARYADLVWDFSKRVTGKGANVEYARIAIDSLTAIANTNAHEHDVEVFRKLQRALKLAVSIGDRGRIAAVKDAVIAFENRVAEDDKPGLWGYSYDLLVADPKLSLSRNERSKVVSALEERLTRVSHKAKPSEINPWASEAAALRLASYYRTNQQPDDMRRVLLVYGQSFEEYAKSGSPLQASFWLQRVHHFYLEYGLSADAEKIAQKIRDLGPRMGDDMKVIDLPMKITKEEMDEYVRQITEGSMTEVLRRIAIRFLPKKGQIESQLRELSEKAPLSFLFPTQIQSHDGRPVATIGSLDQDVDGHIAHQMSQNMVFSTIFLRIAIQGAVTTFQISAETLLSHLLESPAFSEDKKDLLKSGLSFYLAGDHLAVAHILIPQIENTIRCAVELAGGCVIKPNRSGGFYLRTLDDLLRDACTIKILGADAALYMRVLLTDQRGWNVRNGVCHGIVPPGFCSPAVSDRLLHVLLFLSLLRKRISSE